MIVGLKLVTNGTKVTTVFCVQLKEIQSQKVGLFYHEIGLA